MKRFALGFLTGAAVLVLGVVGYLHFGLANVAADTPIPRMADRLGALIPFTPRFAAPSRAT
jgi:hypothetical protein